jgi:type IV secretion system protein VirB6
MATIQVFEPFNTHINALLDTYINTTSASVMSAITPVVTNLAAIYIMWWGWSMIRGLIQEPIMDGVSRMLQISFILALATNTGLYASFVSDWLWQSPDALASIVLNSGGGGSGTSVTFGFLDTMLSKFYERGDYFWQLGIASTIPNFGFLIIAVVVWGFGIGITAYVAFLMILSKLALAVLLGIGPIFIILLMFNATRKFFDAWIGQVINFVFLNMLTAAVAVMMLSIIDSYISGMVSAADIVDVFPMVILSVISIFILRQVPSWAAALGGGVAVSTLGAFGAAASYLKPPSPRQLAQSRANLNANAGIISNQSLNRQLSFQRTNSITQK